MLDVINLENRLCCLRMFNAHFLLRSAVDTAQAVSPGTTDASQSRKTYRLRQGQAVAWSPIEMYPPPFECGNSMSFQPLRRAEATPTVRARNGMRPEPIVDLDQSPVITGTQGARIARKDMGASM
jgi:hypothetical protein